MDDQSHYFWDFSSRVSSFLLILCASKWISERFIFAPIGRKLQVSSRKPPPPPSNPRLEALYEIHGAAAVENVNELSTVAKSQGMTIDDVKRWLTSRRQQDSESDLDKFTYECWVSSYYIVLTTMGFYVMLRQPYMWDINESLKGYPNLLKKPGADVFLYYTLSFAFFVIDFLILMQKKYERNDFLAIRIHHLLTICLMATTWYIRLVAFGSIILFLMELSAPFPYISRIAWRLQFPSACDFVFIVFGVSWIFARVILLHFWAVRSYLTFRLNLEHLTMSQSLSDFFLLAVLVVNAWWTYAIIEKFVKKINFRDMMVTLKGLSIDLAKRGD